MTRRITALLVTMVAVLVVAGVYTTDRNTDTAAWACQYWIQIGSQRLCFIGR